MPNPLVLSPTLVGAVLAFWHGGISGLTLAAAGCGLGFLLVLPGRVFGATGEEQKRQEKLAKEEREQQESLAREQTSPTKKKPSMSREQARRLAEAERTRQEAIAEEAYQAELARQANPSRLASTRASG